MKLAIAAQAADLGTLLVVLAHGGAELNPFVVALLAAGGIPSLALAKLALVSLMAGLRPLFAHRWGLVRAALVTTGLLGAASNVLALVVR